MNVKSWLISGLAGAVVFFILGFIFYGMLLSSYFEGQNTVEGAMRADDALVYWALIVGHLPFGLLLSYIFVKWAGIKTFMTGAKAGAVIMVLISLGYGLIFYATTNIGTLESVLVDTALSILIGGIAGGVVGFVNGKVGDD